MLRPYQNDFAGAIVERFEAKDTRQLGVLPTGGGKSVIIAEIPNRIQLRGNEQMFVFVHREELVDQDAKKLAAQNPKLRIEVEQAKRRASPDANVIVASVPSIGRLRSKPAKGEPVDPDDAPDYSERLRRFDPERGRIFVTDEAHHSTAESYQIVYKYFNICKQVPKFDDRSKLHTGVTATPNRADNLGLDLNFDGIVYNKPLLEMIKEKWLANIIPFRVSTETDIGSVGTRMGDLAKDELEAKINTERRNQIVVDGYKNFGAGEPGIAFTVDVAHTTDLTAQFVKNGVIAVGVTGKTKGRSEILAAYERGEIQVLVSCGVLGEGIDVPRAIVGMMSRPTKSGLLFSQQIGRLLRPFPSPEAYLDMIRRGYTPRYLKRFAIMIDYVDIAGRHRLNNVASLLGLPRDFDLKGSAVTETLEEIEELVKKTKGAAQVEMFKDMKSLRSFAERIDLFSIPVVPTEIKRFSKLSWIGGGTGYYELMIPGPEYVSLRLSMNTLGEFEVYRSTNGFRKLMGKQPTLESALKYADGLVPQEALVVLKTDASWRSDPPTEKQIKRLGELLPDLRRGYRSFGEFSDAMATRFNKGAASTLITQELAKGGGYRPRG